MSVVTASATAALAELSYANVARRANRFSRNATAKSEALSETTRTTSDGEVGSSDGEWECRPEFLSEASAPCDVASEKECPQPPVATVVRPRAQLSSKASLFVPRQAPVAIVVPIVPSVVFQPPADPVPAVIRQVFGSNLKNIKTTETEHSTSLQVELDSAASSPEQEQSIRSHAVQCLTVALDGTLSRNLKDMRSSADGSELSFEYFSQGTHRLCWKFVSGCCRRGGDCYWEHAMAQFFLISFVLSAQQPSPDAACPDEGQVVEPDVASPIMELQPLKQPMLPDMREASKQASSTRSSSPDSTVASSTVSPARSGLVSPAGRIAWADLEDDDDEF